MWKISIKKSLYKEDLTYLHEKLKNKAPNIILHEKQLKLYDFIEDFVEIKYKIFLEIDKAKYKSKSVTTDLKEEYRKPIDKLMMDHQFCQFHLQQKINRDLKKFIKENNLNENEINKLYQQKKRINLIIYTQTIKNARKILEDILNNKKNYYKPIIEICKKNYTTIS